MPEPRFKRGEFVRLNPEQGYALYLANTQGADLTMLYEITGVNADGMFARYAVMIHGRPRVMNEDELLPAIPEPLLTVEVP